jgi:hypothetical protein
VTIANTARAAVATAVSWVAKMSDMGEAYCLYGCSVPSYFDLKNSRGGL